MCHSCGGKGAAAWLLRPVKPSHYFSDEQFKVTLRSRLDLAQELGGGTCQHISGSGVTCGAVLDGRGTHAMICSSGGWTCRRHDRSRDALAGYAEAHGGAVTKETILPYIAPGHLQSRMDVVLRAARTTGQMLVDVTIVSPLTQEMLRSGAAARVPGAAASAAAAHKRQTYPNSNVVPFAIEHFGRWGEDAIALVKTLAPPPGNGRSEALTCIYQDVACEIQKSNADAILAAAVRDRCARASHIRARPSNAR